MDLIAQCSTLPFKYHREIKHRFAGRLYLSQCAHTRSRGGQVRAHVLASLRGCACAMNMLRKCR